MCNLFLKCTGINLIVLKQRDLLGLSRSIYNVLCGREPKFTQWTLAECNKRGSLGIHGYPVNDVIRQFGVLPDGTPVGPSLRPISVPTMALKT